MIETYDRVALDQIGQKFFGLSFDELCDLSREKIYCGLGRLLAMIPLRESCFTHKLADVDRIPELVKQCLNYLEALKYVKDWAHWPVCGIELKQPDRKIHKPSWELTLGPLDLTCRFARPVKSTKNVILRLGWEGNLRWSHRRHTADGLSLYAPQFRMIILEVTRPTALFPLLDKDRARFEQYFTVEQL